VAATKTDIVDDLFDAAYKINQEQEGLNERRNGVRNSLRSLKSAGVLSAEQVKEVDELYPVITRTRKNGDEPGDTGE
jgi:hypothetical protein